MGLGAGGYTTVAPTVGLLFYAMNTDAGYEEPPHATTLANLTLSGSVNNISLCVASYELPGVGHTDVVHGILADGLMGWTEDHVAIKRILAPRLMTR